MSNDKINSIEYVFYWLVVFDLTDGSFYNINLIEDKNTTLNAIAREFEIKNPKYLVAKAGIGLNNRTAELKKLPFLYYYNY